MPTTPLMTPGRLDLSSRKGVGKAFRVAMNAYHQVAKTGFTLMDVSNAPIAKRRKQKQTSSDQSRSPSSESNESETTHEYESVRKKVRLSPSVCDSQHPGPVPSIICTADPSGIVSPGIPINTSPTKGTSRGFDFGGHVSASKNVDTATSVGTSSNFDGNLTLPNQTNESAFNMGLCPDSGRTYSSVSEATTSDDSNPLPPSFFVDNPWALPTTEPMVCTSNILHMLSEQSESGLYSSGLWPYPHDGHNTLYQPYQMDRPAHTGTESAHTSLAWTNQINAPWMHSTNSDNNNNNNNDEFSTEKNNNNNNDGNRADLSHKKVGNGKLPHGIDASKPLDGCSDKVS